MKEEEKEELFQCHAYGKSELAQLYCPNIEPKTALAKLNRWIILKPGLKDALIAAGLCPHAKQFTPAQVHLIINAIGEP